MPRPVRLVDATLRDGSYCVDFQFTAADTAVLVSMLDAAGVGFIEIGHGSGTFNHKAPPEFRSKTRQAATDEEYLAAARACARNAKLGVITGPFGIDDLAVCAAHGVDFVRLACMADRTLEPKNLQMAERAKALGLTFSVNMMQTTAITPARVAEIAVELSKVGVDWLYIVDSSGGLLPQAVTEYVSSVRDASDITIGFHAHHNSGLAIANSLAAIEAGATMIDGTLQGLGRDVGNAPTEQLLFMLQRLGFEREIDVEGVCHAGDLARGLLRDKGNDPTYYASGSSEIHSSNVLALVELARHRGLGARSLLGAIGHGTTKLIGAGMKTFPDEIVGPAAARARSVEEPVLRREVVEVLGDAIARASSTLLATAADVLFARAAKWNKTSVLHLVPDEQFPFRGPLPWDLGHLCGITIGVPRGALDHLDLGDRKPGVLVIDPALAIEPLPTAVSSVLDEFRPVMIDATASLAALCMQQGARVWVLCAQSMAQQLAARNDRLRVVTAADGEAWQAEVAASDTMIVVTTDVPPEVAALGQRGTRLLRPGLATAIATHVVALLELRTRLAGGPGEGGLVDPIFIPTHDQSAVDDPACPTTLVDGPGRRDVVLAAATARARTLARGHGRL